MVGVFELFFRRGVDDLVVFRVVWRFGFGFFVRLLCDFGCLDFGRIVVFGYVVY